MVNFYCNKKFIEYLHQVILSRELEGTIFPMTISFYKVRLPLHRDMFSLRVNGRLLIIITKVSLQKNTSYLSFLHTLLYFIMKYCKFFVLKNYFKNEQEIRQINILWDPWCESASFLIFDLLTSIGFGSTVLLTTLLPASLVVVEICDCKEKFRHVFTV